MMVKLLTEHHLEFLSLKGGCRGPSESTLVKMSNCWKSYAAAQIISCHWNFFRNYHVCSRNDNKDIRNKFMNTCQRKMHAY